MTLSAEIYRGWSALREATDPYFHAIYPQVGALLDGAGTILDLGGGEGHTHDMLPAEFSPRLTTVDADSQALARLAARYPEAATVHADITRLPFEDESVDAAISIQGMPTDLRAPREVARVLKPGGVFVLLNDLPYPVEGITQTLIAERSLVERNHLYGLPVFNEASGNADMIAILRRDTLEHPALRGSAVAREGLELAAPLLGNDWMQRIYANKLYVARYARLFARLMAEVQATLGDEAVSMIGPLNEEAESEHLDYLNEPSGVEVEKVTLSADFRTGAPHVIEGRPVANLTMDELAFPHIAYSPRDGEAIASTHVKGRTPIYIMRKALV